MSQNTVDKMHEVQANEEETVGGCLAGNPTLTQMVTNDPSTKAHNERNFLEWGFFDKQEKIGPSWYRYRLLNGHVIFSSRDYAHNGEAHRNTRKGRLSTDPNRHRYPSRARKSY
jgi:hypothetical protein